MYGDKRRVRLRLTNAPGLGRDRQRRMANGQSERAKGRNAANRRPSTDPRDSLTLRMEDSVTRILKSQASQPELAAQLEKFRRKITVMFTDIKGSTAFFERFGDAAGLMMVEHCNSLVSHIAEQHGGRVIKTIGDSVMAAFEDNCMAIAAAIEMQRALTMENVAKPEPERVSIRIGLNYGPGIVKTNDVFGDVVNVASRVESAASPEQIVISDAL